jgi:hypothetical protein
VDEKYRVLYNLFVIVSLKWGIRLFLALSYHTIIHGIGKFQTKGVKGFKSPASGAGSSNEYSIEKPLTSLCFYWQKICAIDCGPMCGRSAGTKAFSGVYHQSSLAFLEKEK